jgi:hypothetical protein
MKQICYLGKWATALIFFSFNWVAITKPWRVETAMLSAELFFNSSQLGGSSSQLGEGFEKSFRPAGFLSALII